MHGNYDVKWCYGMTLMGDPCITIGKLPQRVPQISEQQTASTIMDENVRITCFSINGVLLFDNGSMEQVQALPSGMYILQCKQTNQLVNTHKFIKL